MDLEIRDHEKKQEEVVVLPVMKEDKQKDPKPTIRLPYPQRTKKKKNEKIFEKFLEIFKNFETNIPFAEAMDQIPLYAKFMKDIVSKKRPTNTEHVLLTETCSAILQGMKILVEKKDKRSVTIPCTIGNRTFKKALIDLGASVSLMPLSIYKKWVLARFKTLG